MKLLLKLNVVATGKIDLHQVATSKNDIYIYIYMKFEECYKRNQRREPSSENTWGKITFGQYE